MIALRGKFERDGAKWRWKGQWVFGTDVNKENEAQALPFEYEFVREIDPATIPVPTAEDNEETERDIEKKEAEEEVKHEDDTRPKETVPPEASIEEDRLVPEERTLDENSNDDTKSEDKQAGEENKNNKLTAVTTFADDNFTDASLSHPCPMSGLWKGHFETLTNKKTTVPIKEHFYLFINATPPPAVCIQFTDEDQPQAASTLPEKSLYVRGTGENQYGTFELLGSYALDTEILQLQRLYVRTTPSRPRSRSRATSNEGRAMQTRKKQLSWRRTDAWDESKTVRRSEPKRKKLKIEPIIIPPKPKKRSSAPRTGTMSLPEAGDPLLARWRAAHFLYYQRQPTDDATGISPMTPKYVVYEGEMLHGNRHGRGVCLFSDGTLYEGEWKYNKEHGIGTLMSADRKRLIYKGEWERGKIHGKGIFYYNTKKMDHYYEGDFKETLRHGDGKYVLPDGSLYVGQWKDSNMCGRGIFTWPDGSVYDGEWKDGKRHGQGLLKSVDGFTYDGTWVRNAMEGRGVAIYPNGQEYHGSFANGRREGRGSFFFQNGSVYEGRFRDDAIDGQGTMKMTKTMTVPNEDEDSGVDFMIPVSFHSDMGHIHRKAGFTVGGK